jgi:phospholipid/cholesterol/gamma-HCH transport system permease protein
VAAGLQGDDGMTSVSVGAISAPARSVGQFFAMPLDTVMLMFKPRFTWREFHLQTWFVGRVSRVHTMMLSIPFPVLTVFILDILLAAIGAGDASGTGAAFGAATQIGPVVTVLVVAGAGATAMCADLGARTIREELDALRVMGIDPIQALVVPRVLAATVVALLLSSVVTVVGLTGGFIFSVFIQGVTPGAFVAGLTPPVGLPEVAISVVKVMMVLGACALPPKIQALLGSGAHTRQTVELAAQSDPAHCYVAHKTLLLWCGASLIAEQLRDRRRK